MSNEAPYRDLRPVMKRGEVIKFIKVRDVKTPAYGTRGSVGLDFFVPNDFEAVTLKPGEDINIPSGIKARIPKDTALIAKNKSGVALRDKFIKGAQVIDWDYQGEIHLHVFNVGLDDVTITPGKKLIQFILTPIIHAKMLEVQAEEDLFPQVSERGDGGFGSTGDK